VLLEKIVVVAQRLGAGSVLPVDQEVHPSLSLAVASALLNVQPRSARKRTRLPGPDPVRAAQFL
jgi:hypothetical protein